MSSNEEIEIGNFAPRDRMVEPGRPIQVVDWNIDRGLKLAGVIDFLDSTNADLILLQAEIDDPLDLTFAQQSVFPNLVARID